MTRRQTASIVFVVLCVVLVAAAVTLNIGWILANGRSVAPLVFGIIAFSLIIAGIIIYTVFLVREMGITEQQDSFLNSVTHELKTPIASIRLYLETLQSRDVGDAQRKEFYRIMLQDAERLQNTVEQVLRAGAARQKSKLHHIAPVDLAWLVGECVDTARLRHNLPAERRRDGGLRSPTALVVDGDVDDLRTAIANLLDNAVKYSGGPPQVTVQAAGPTPNTAWIRVKDAGVGIPTRAAQSHLQPLLSIPGRSFKTKGTGLGLYIVRSIAKRHGGRVFAESAGEGKGATFTLELPRSQGPVLTERERRKRPGHERAAASRRMSRILIVEDEAHLAEGLRFNLEAEGHAVDVDGDGQKALERLLADRDGYDAVVLDVMLPGKDGFTVAKELRAAGHYVPVLMLTARSRPADVLQGFEAGADDYLPKPFELQILLARLRGLLRRRQWMQQDQHEHEQLTFAGKTLDLEALELHVGEKAYQLTQMECDLLQYLVKNVGRPVSRKAILEDVWDLHEDTDTRAIDNFIVRLRRYLEKDPTKPKHLLTVRGVGYKFVE